MSEPKPRISTGRKFNPIWTLPVVAVLIGLYMVIHTKLTEGPEITIRFSTAEGLEAGKTKIRYRDVDIGIVDNVSLSDSMDKVVVTARMNREAADMLREDTRFWVVRARVGAGAISGIGTILSGAYIHLDPGAGKKKMHQFVGLEVPPLTPGDAPGVRLTLLSDHAGFLNAGDAIVYNGYEVGRIEAISFDIDRKEVRYDTFIDAPYNDLVTTTSRFWNVSGVAVTATASGIDITTGSLETILLGGIAFGNLPNLPQGEKVASGETFRLASSYGELEEDPYQFGGYFVTKFQQSLRGLEPGAPVEYRGIQIGRVEKIMLKELIRGQVSEGDAIPVLIYLEPGRLGITDSAESVEQMHTSVANSIVNGMRATLQSSNLLTGKLFVNIEYYPDEKKAAPEEFEGYAVIPTISGGLGRLEQQVSSLLEKFNSLPLDSMFASANTTLGTMDGTLAQLTATLDSAQQILAQDGMKALPGELNRTLADLRKVLTSLSPDSAVGQSLSNSVFELNRTMRNLEDLTRSLSEKPNSLVFPADTPADPIPEARSR